ncbi:MAG: 3-phosphoshikimate 1-carboxyvinyltransferase [Nitrososphaerota archaeon]|nr:3-phosphoshikimate 1-carboxyvinyltransferase [Nitrososphaerota archaeon]MDG6943193.1 3-phosphoshikimate 1-carboxyvinyltransferase [Nitrososphaerota archaeon]MDG6950929.1 3-phosphoshikimate 1-carboxyvinyltransferase [Nitrososphaerota archaeon]
MVARVTIANRGALGGSVRVPPSKSYTHRSVITASLSLGESRIESPLRSRDTIATFDACKAMGARIADSEAGLVITGAEPRAAKEVNVENSGTTLRFMTSVFALPPRGRTVLTGDASVRRRPMQGLLDALAQLGVEARSAAGNGCAPIVVGEGGMRGGHARLRGDVSSQFVSSVLISAPLAREDSRLKVVDPVSRPYIDATLKLSELHGIHIEREGYGSFGVSAGQQYRPADFLVPADFSSAAFIMAAAALAGGRVELLGLRDALPQADSAILNMLENLGVGVERRPDSVIVSADGERLKGGSFCLGDSPDLLPVLAALGLKCEEPLEISGVAHARLKETDRISVLTKEFSKVGAKVEERADGMTITRPHEFVRSSLDAHDDHRMFMAFALVSLLVPGGVPVIGAECLDVSYPGFLSDMERIGVGVVID